MTNETTKTMAEHWTELFVNHARACGAADPAALGVAVFAEHRSDIISEETTRRILDEIEQRSVGEKQGEMVVHPDELRLYVCRNDDENNGVIAPCATEFWMRTRGADAPVVSCPFCEQRVDAREGRDARMPLPTNDESASQPEG